MNPRAREADDCIISIVLSYAAIETAWHWEQIQANVPIHKWPEELYEGLCAVATKRGRLRPEAPDPNLLERAKYLAAWRNFIQHADPRARARLERQLGSVGPDALNADLAEYSLGVAKEFGDYLAVATGSQRQFDTNWVDPNEM